MNTNGRNSIGTTPGFKLRNIKNYFIDQAPDVVFIQDAIPVNEIKGVVDDVHKGGYESHFFDAREDDESAEDGSQVLCNLDFDIEKSDLIYIQNIL